MPWLVILAGVVAMIAADIELTGNQAELACWAVIILLVIALALRRRRKVL